MGLSFGEDLGPVKVYGLVAEHHCEVRVNGEETGILYAGKGVYEFRSESGVGADELKWISSRSKEVIVERLTRSLEKQRVEMRKQLMKQWTKST